MGSCRGKCGAHGSELVPGREMLGSGAQADDAPTGQVSGGDEQCQGDGGRIPEDETADLLFGSAPDGEGAGQ